MKIKEACFILFLILAPLFSFHADSQQPDTTKKSGKASFYNDKFHGKVTSNGEQYDQADFTAAHRTLPFNSLVLVTNKKNGKSVIVRINDRGPFLKSRIIDLSRSAAQKIKMVPYGVVPVSISVLTLLDQVPLADSSFAEDEVWDCYGNKIKLKDYSIKFWETPNWKHAFYVASKFVLENKNENIGVLIKGKPENRVYSLVMTSIPETDTADSLIRVLNDQGYTRAKIIE